MQLWSKNRWHQSHIFCGAKKRKDSVQHFPSRTSGRRAVSAVSLFYYFFFRKSMSCPVPCRSARDNHPASPAHSLALSQCSPELTPPPWFTHTQSVQCVYIGAVSSTGFQFDLETRVVSGPQSLPSSLLPTLPWPGAQRFR